MLDILVLALYLLVLLLAAIAVMVEYRRYEIRSARRALIREQLMDQPAPSVLPAARPPRARSFG